jgi:DNA repair exonuclease SbcCD ATPase subunit
MKIYHFEYPLRMYLFYISPSLDKPTKFLINRPSKGMTFEQATTMHTVGERCPCCGQNLPSDKKVVNKQTETANVRKLINCLVQ